MGLWYKPQCLLRQCLLRSHIKIDFMFCGNIMLAQNFLIASERILSDKTLNESIVGDGALLTPRQAKLLAIVVQEYAKSAQPVGSSAIAQAYDLGVSSATIRNDLSTLEREG